MLIINDKTSFFIILKEILLSHSNCDLFFNDFFSLHLKFYISLLLRIMDTHGDRTFSCILAIVSSI